MNALMVIHPYKDEGIWMFDDPRVGLIKEPFISGADAILDRMTETISNAPLGVTVLFSSTPFPGHQWELQRRRQEYGGYWYFSPAHDLEGWLCPALFKYFDSAPESLYVQAKPKA